MNEALPEMIDLCDILCPNRQLFYSCGEEYRKFFVDQRNKGKRLEFYSCSGPMRLLDPFAYCRLQAWDCWKYRADATYFWAFADGAGTSSWNEYLCPRNTYTPLFIDETSVYSGKHLEAMREGIEDYEYFVILSKALKDSPCNEQTKKQIEKILYLTTESILSLMPEKGVLFWRDSKYPHLINHARHQLLQVILQLQSHN